MKKKILVFLFFLCSWFFISAQVTEKRTVKLMGSRFDITIAAGSEVRARDAVNKAIAEIQRIEKCISSWDANSETSQINRNAGIQPVKVSKELFELIQRSLQVSAVTGGAFDISFASIDKVWYFDGRMTQMPSEESIKASVEKVGYKNIVLNTDEQTVFLKLPGMKIGFGAIGKGYAADKVRTLMKEMGIPAGIINASGDLTTWGYQPDGTEWKVGITNPLNQNKVFSWFPVVEAAVATSGNYEKYVVLNGKKYTHIIDPRTGYPASGLVSVTVFAKSAELCDALATAIFIMGTQSGIHMIDQLPGIECVLVDENNKIHTSKNIQLNPANP
ncbi:FAD:protein FMN transferase [Ascidiimonas aurantiaca]|uniref:FAD:protein FMN transferase n=1 Tax=Ascidiimonas aurantiaca TaxID=1685432 RepID=UPI0030ECEB18